MATLRTKLQLRNDVTANWNTADPTLSKGEIGIEWIVDSASGTEGSCKIKVGDGFTPWTKLNYFGGDAINIAFEGEGNTIVDVEVGKPDEHGVVTYTFKKANRVIDVTTTDDDVVIVTPKNPEVPVGNVELDFKHATQGPSKTADTTKGPATGATISGSGAKGSIVVPRLTVNKYGHVTALSEQTLSVTLPNLSIKDDTSPDSKTTDEVTVVENITTNGHEIVLDKTKVVTKAYVDRTVNPGMEFKGVLALTTLESLPNPENVKRGDSYKISSSGVASVKAGDLIIANDDKAPKTIGDGAAFGWSLIPSGDTDSDTWRNLQVEGKDWKGNEISTGLVNFVSKKVDNTAGITLTINDNNLEIAHADTSSVKNLVSSGRTYITGMTFDTYGHVTGYSTSSESVNDTWRNITINGKATKMTTDVNTGALNLKNGGNITITCADNSNDVVIAAHDTTYGVVSSTAHGLAPKMDNNKHAFLARVGSDANPTWQTIITLDGGSASTSDWGTITTE